jgi:hypothetical protein
VRSMRTIKKMKTKHIRTELSYLLFFLSFPFYATYAVVGDGVHDHGRGAKRKNRECDGRLKGFFAILFLCEYIYVTRGTGCSFVLLFLLFFSSFHSFAFLCFVIIMVVRAEWGQV